MIMLEIVVRIIVCSSQHKKITFEIRSSKTDINYDIHCFSGRGGALGSGAAL